MLENIQSLGEMVEQLEQYSKERKGEIDRNKTSQALIKTYCLETAPAPHRHANGGKGHDPWLRSVFRVESLSPDFLRVREKSSEQLVGYAEAIDDRFYALYSVEDSDPMDRLIKRWVKDNPYFDHVWFSGSTFHYLFEHFVVPQRPLYTHLKFQFRPLYERLSRSQDDDSESLFDDETLEGNSFMLTERTQRFRESLSRLRELLPTFSAPSLLRFPAANYKGGHDLYAYGKVTNRSDSFMDHRDLIRTILRFYGESVVEIEQKAWLDTETMTVTADDSPLVRLRGVPITLQLSEEVSPGSFTKFIERAFGSGHEPFRLWGNPIRVSDVRYHVYALDLHLYEPLYLELTPSHFQVFLPRGTCGNTVHRFVTLIQQNLDPNPQVFIGDQPWESILSEAWQKAQVTKP